MISLSRAKLLAKADIDRVAGLVRCNYVTETPGQQAVYLVKLEQAKAYADAYASNTNAAVPPYISLEAQAMGISAIDLANQIISISSNWNDVVGPTIESIRVSGKNTISQQTTIEGVNSNLQTVLEALRSI